MRTTDGAREGQTSMPDQIRKLEDFFMKPFEKLPIGVFSLDDMQKFLEVPFDGYVVSIRSPYANYQDQYIPLDKLEGNCRGMIKQYFEDAEAQVDPDMIIPEREDIERILDWTRDIDIKKHRIAVHCFAGISRSSAMAYIIACSKMPVEEAKGVFDLLWHNPNWRIVGFGADVLGDSKIYNEARKHFRC